MKNKLISLPGMLLLLIATIFLSFTASQENDYFTLFESSNNIKYFKYGKNSYHEFFLNDKEKINGKDYLLK